MMPSVLHRYPGIYLITEKNLGKPQLGDRHEGNATSHRQKWALSPPHDVGRVEQYFRK